jgi:hypothetical protein
MKKLLAATLFSAGLVLGGPTASAAVVLGSNNVNNTFTISFNGFTGSPAGVIPGLSANIQFTLAGYSSTANSSSWVFNYIINNTSGAPVTASRLSTFGFDTDPNVNTATTSASGIFSNITYNANQPNQAPDVELCFSSQSCPGGGGGGVTQGNSGSGSFTLGFASAITQLTLSDFVIRWQSLTYPGVTGGSGSGIETGCVGPNCEDRNVPEPGTLALLGLGAIGFALRRRRSA